MDDDIQKIFSTVQNMVSEVICRKRSRKYTAYKKSHSKSSIKGTLQFSSKKSHETVQTHIFYVCTIKFFLHFSIAQTALFSSHFLPPFTILKVELTLHLMKITKVKKCFHSTYVKLLFHLHSPVSTRE
jgi:hypothetical protein